LGVAASHRRLAALISQVRTRYQACAEQAGTYETVFQKISSVCTHDSWLFIVKIDVNYSM
jgi:hypothetical protein